MPPQGGPQVRPPGGPPGPPRQPFGMGAAPGAGPPGRPPAMTNSTGPVRPPGPPGSPGHATRNYGPRETGSNASTPNSIATDELWMDAADDGPTHSGVARPPRDVPDLALPAAEGEAQPRKKWFGFM